MHRLCVLPLVAVLIAGGCGSPSADDATSTISGQVTMGGGPVTDAVIVFSSPAAGAGGSAVVDEDGTYQLTDPLPAGTYQVTLTPAPVPPPNPGEPVPVITPSRIPEKYFSPESSGLTAEVVSGENTFNFELTP